MGNGDRVGQRWHRVYGIKVGFNFKLFALAELGADLLVKVNGNLYTKRHVKAHLCFAPNGW